MEPRPFEEVMVDLINNSSCGEQEYLALIIRKTRFLRNHSAIIEAWITQRRKMVYFDDLGVVEYLRQQIDTV